MKGFLIDMTKDGKAEIHLDQRVEGYGSTLQNALVILGTDKGSDKAFPDKGTNLLKAATRGLMIDGQAALHQAQFAAIDVLFFSRSFEISETDEMIREIKLTPSTITTDKISLQVQFTSTLGNVAGTAISV